MDRPVIEILPDVDAEASNEVYENSNDAGENSNGLYENANEEYGRSNELYECDFCALLFVVHSEFKDHLKTHIREERFIEVTPKIEPDDDLINGTEVKREPNVDLINGMEIKHEPHVDLNNDNESNVDLISGMDIWHNSNDYLINSKEVKLEPNVDSDLINNREIKLETNATNGDLINAIEVKPNVDQIRGVGVKQEPDNQPGGAGVSLQCLICNKRFGHQSILSMHMKKHLGDKHKCEECGKTFSAKGDLVSHMRRHNKDMPFGYLVLGTRFQEMRRRDLLGAVPRAGESKIREILQGGATGVNYSDTCGSTSNQNADVNDPFKEDDKTHVETCLPSGDEEKPFMCYLCTRKFKNKERVASHLTTYHGGERPFGCSVCSKRFVDKGGLNMHMKRHSAPKIDCPVCGKLFALKGDLNQHLTTHTGALPYECSECGRRFRCKRNYHKHKVTHSGIKKYECTVCSAKFHQKGNLSSHVKTHCKKEADKLKRKKKKESKMPNEAGLTCLICGRGYKNQLGLKVHLAAHNKQDKFEKIKDEGQHLPGSLHS